MQLCTSLAIRYLYCISSRCYVFVQEAIKDFEFEFEFVFVTTVFCDGLEGEVISYHWRYIL